MNDNDQTAHQSPQPDEPEETPAQALGEYLELIDKDVDERVTDAVVEERLQQFLLQVAHDEVSGDTTTDTAGAEGQQDTAAEGDPENAAPPVLDELVDALLQPQHGTAASLRSTRAAWLNTARLEAEGILNVARRQAEQYQDAALQQAALTMRNAREEAERILMEARTEASQITQVARAQASLTALTPPLLVTPMAPVMAGLQSALWKICETLKESITAGPTQPRERLLVPLHHEQGNAFPSGSIRTLTVLYDAIQDDLDVVPDLRIEGPEGWTCIQVKRHLRRALADPASCGTRMKTRTGADRQRARAELLRLLARKHFAWGRCPEPAMEELQIYLRQLARHSAAEDTLQPTELLLPCLIHTNMLGVGLTSRLVPPPALLEAALASGDRQVAKVLLACSGDSTNDGERELVGGDRLLGPV